MASKYPASPLLKATLSQLITHTAGLPREVPQDKSMPQTGGIAWRADTVEFAMKDPDLVEPGTINSYSNIGPIVAVAMVERTLGGKYPYEQWINGPEGRAIGSSSPRSLDWTTTPGTDDIFPHYLNADGSVSLHNKPSNGVPTSSVYAPEGSCSITLSDLCSFALGTLYNSCNMPVDQYQKLISTSSTAPNGAATFAGWSPDSDGGLHHSGSTGRGEYCLVWMNPTRKAATILYVNAGYRPGTDPGLNSGMSPLLNDLHNLTVTLRILTQ